MVDKRSSPLVKKSQSINRPLRLRTLATNLRTPTTSGNVGSDENPHRTREKIRPQSSLRPSSSGSMLSRILRTDASASPIKLACSDLPGIAHPSNRQAKNRSVRIWSDRDPTISGYQIVSAANRTVKNITSVSVVESRIQEIQRASALRASQSTEMPSKTRVGDVTTIASDTCSAPSPIVGTQRKLLRALRTPGRRRLRIHPGFPMEGKDVMSNRSERTSASAKLQGVYSGTVGYQL